MIRVYIDRLLFNGKAHVQKNKLINTGQYEESSCMADYVQHMLSYVDLNNFAPLKIVVNAGNGSAGPALDAIEKAMHNKRVPIEFIKVHHSADGTFPNGIPNPLLPENRADTADAVKASGADFGIAWDADFDRCFLFDADGDFIEGYYIAGLLAEAFIEKNINSKIINERMRKEDAVYGGEMSAHYYFRDFAYCDSGMSPWLLIAELVCVKKQALASMVKERIEAFSSSGEINSKLKDADAALERVTNKYKPLASVVDTTDGLGLEFHTWCFNLRKSNTEPVIRLNVKSKGDIPLLEEKTKEVLALNRAE